MCVSVWLPNIFKFVLGFLRLPSEPRSEDQRTTAVMAQRHDMALRELDEILGRFGYDLAAFELPLPVASAPTKQASKELRREMDFDRDFETQRAETKRSMMRQNPEQANAYDTIVEHVFLGTSPSDRIVRTSLAAPRASLCVASRRSRCCAVARGVSVARCFFGRVVRVMLWTSRVYGTPQIAQASHVYTLVKHPKVRADSPGVFFVDGPGGSGKTFLYEALLHFARGEGWPALACAWSGIAATLLEKGRTCHSRFGLPVPLPRDDVTSSISAQSGRAEVLREARLLLWDEAPMAPKEALAAVDRLLRDLMDTPDVPFGGKVLVLGGDFRQVLPVMPHCSREDVVSHSLKESTLWREGSVKVIALRRNMRAHAATDAWREYLLQVGDGRVPTHDDLATDMIRLPDEIAAPRTWTVTDLVSHTYPKLAAVSRAVLQENAREEDMAYFCERAILSPRNADVDELNAEILKLFPEDAKTTYYSQDSVDAATPEELLLWPMDFLNSLTVSGLPPHELSLCPGVVVMLLRNLDIERGLCNGVRAIVVKTHRYVLDLLLISGTNKGSRVYVPRLSLAPKSPDLPFVLRRKQFPVKLAWGMTINKAQGQTLVRVGIYLPRPVFTHGQLYVALSRAGAPGFVRVLIVEGELQFHITEADGGTLQPGTYTQNVVWEEALLPTVDPEAPPLAPPPPRQLNLRAAFQRGRASRHLGSGMAPADVPTMENPPPDEASGLAGPRLS